MAFSSQPRLSFVVAVTADDAAFLNRFLEQLEPQRPPDAEVIVVIQDSKLVPSTTRSRWSAVQWIDSDRPLLAPELWSQGVARAGGDLVVIGIPACLPSNSWVRNILRADWNTHAGVGGPIELAYDAGLVGCGVYFVRYASYMLPFQGRVVPEIPGDNGTYRRDALDRHAAWIKSEGFWESALNRRLRSEGETLWMDPKIVVVHCNPFSIGAFSRQRLRHGLVFGRQRAAGAPLVQRLMQLALEPAVPFLMLARVASTVRSRGRHFTRFLVAMPVTLWFFSCWAAGEACGLILGSES